MATITGNYVDADPTQWWTLDYTFANSKFTWSVTAHASHASYWNSIYGLTVNVGGNSYYKGDITWQNYTPNTVVYSGTTNLTDCTISNGAVTLSVSGNFYYGTWNSAYTSSGSGTCAVSPPTVTALTYSATNQYSSMVVAGRSVITFTMKGTSQTGSSTITYNLYQDGSAISTSTGASGSNKTVQVTAPSAGSHSYYYRATDGNGTTSTSGTISITTYAYTAPSFNSVSAVRWTTGTSSGTASDEGTYCKATASWNVGKVGTTNLTTTLKVTVNSTSSTTTTNGASLYMGGGALSADNSYTVTFKLYDSYTGETNGVVRTDTLTMGGRGLDFIYQNGHYGIAVGQKATANRFDTNMPSYIEGIRYGNTSLPNNHIASGSTVTGMLKNLYNVGTSASSGSSSSNYYHFATITATRAYANGDIAFIIGGRAIPLSTVHLRIQSSTSVTASINSFWVDGDVNVYAYVSGTTIDLYVRAGVAYGTMTLYQVYIPQYEVGKISIATPMDMVTSLPSGYTQATILGSPSPTISTSAIAHTGGWTINAQSTRKWDRVVMVSLTLNASSSISTGNNAFTGTLASGYRPLVNVSASSYYGSAVMTAILRTDGSITVRVGGSGSAGSSGDTEVFTWTYII